MGILNEFSEYIYANYKMEEGNIFIPIVISRNEYRHFGMRENGYKLFIEDVIYLFTNEEEEMEKLAKKINLKDHISFLKIYYHIRNAGFNLLREAGGYLIFKRSKDFNRKIEEPMARLIYTEKYNMPKLIHKYGDKYIGLDIIYAIFSDDTFTFMKVAGKRKLSLTYTNEYKYNRKH